MNKNVSITGASGFIGSHLMKRLNKEFVAPRVIAHEDIIRGNFECDILFFLSTYGNMAHHGNHYAVIHANVMDVIRAISWSPKWLLFMSSSSVNLPVQTPYSRSKRAAEEILQAVPLLKSCIVRPYSVTGVGEQKEHLIPTLIRSCMEGTPMDFDASPVHDFVDVEDVVDGLVTLADQEFTGIIEFGNGIAYSNQDVRELVEKVCSSKANIQSHLRLRAYDNTSWYCREHHPLWKPKKSLEMSVHEMVEAYAKNH